MIEIDGARFSGSGTILRYSMSLATLVGSPVRIYNIRSNREKPGLRPQHLAAVRACCELSQGCVEGDRVGSREVIYRPGSQRPRGGEIHWDVGTAGSVTMLALTVLPLALCAVEKCRFYFTGGLFQDMAPTALHLQRVVVPILRRMGAKLDMEILQPGYVPTGKGKLKLTIEPLEKSLAPIALTESGKIRAVYGVALASHLKSARVTERLAESCRAPWRQRGFDLAIEEINDTTARQKGAALLLCCETSTGVLLGADQAGKPGRSSEKIGRSVAATLLEDLDSGATVDRHLSDQLVLFSALGKGTSRYRVPEISEHVESNLWMVSRLMGVNSRINNRVVEVDGVG